MYRDCGSIKGKQQSQPGKNGEVFFEVRVSVITCIILYYRCLHAHAHMCACTHTHPYARVQNTTIYQH